MNILLLEPTYKNKYPPLGLMKIAAFHNNRNDHIIFAKSYNNQLMDTQWDRIYINSLFTFEWPATQKMIHFAYKLVKNRSKIYLGGIAATLLTDFIKDQEPDINIVCGLLNEPGKLNLAHDEVIDCLPPNYEILQQISYKYPMQDAYFTYATRGCGMNCSFCAVQKLEPIYIDYVHIKDQINAVKTLYGEKRHLMLMDNNVLKSPKLADIINDIISLGFGADNAYMINPATKKRVKRYVDFNQGLDANFLTPEKAAQLARISLRPVRIAFDHIRQKEKYLKAIQTCFDAGLNTFSNYLLYNSDEASWKGHEYGADTPEDLYNRLLFNVDLCAELQSILDKKCINKKVNIFSFPMRYIPLDDTKRGYIGTHWNKKYLRAIQVFLNPTQGKGVSSKSFFEAAFGANIDEFKLALQMPEIILRARGKYHPRATDSNVDKSNKFEKFKTNQQLIQEWTILYNILLKLNLWDDFIKKYILNNNFTIGTLNDIKNPYEKEMYFYYLTPEKISHHIKELSLEDIKLLKDDFKRTHKIYFSMISKACGTPNLI